MGDFEHRGAWLEKWDDPALVISAEEVGAWQPLIEGEKAARRCGQLFLVLTAGRDSEMEVYRMGSVAKLRNSYARLWVAWKALDAKRDHRWALNEVDLTVGAEAFRAAREWSLEEFLTAQLPAIRLSAVVGVRHALATLGRVTKKPERKEVNEIIAIIGKELDYLRWAL